MSEVSQQRSEKTEEVFQRLDADSNNLTEVEGIMTAIPGPLPSPTNYLLNSSTVIPKQEGAEYIVNVNDHLDMKRHVVTSAHSTVYIPQVAILLPASPTNGEVTTIEGILSRIGMGLRKYQARRKVEHPKEYEQIEEYLNNLDKCMELEIKFTMTVRDISGNCLIAHRADCMDISEDQSLRSKKFKRTKEEDQLLGIQDCPALQEEPEENEEEDDAGKTDFKDEVLQMATTCPECRAPCFTKMTVTDIPLFKEVLIMAADCDNCGSRTNKRTGSSAAIKGRQIHFTVEAQRDLKREYFMTRETRVGLACCKLRLYFAWCPKAGKLGNIEGLLLDIKKQLSDENPLIGGDSVESSLKSKMEKFCGELDRLLTGEHEFTIVLDDPAGNCHIQNVYAPEDDPEMTIIEYEL